MVVSGGSSPSSGASWTGRAAKPRPLVLAVHAHALAGNGQLGAGGVCCGATTACQSASTQQGLGQLSRDCTGAHHGLGRPRCKQPQLPQPPGQQVRHLQLPSPPHPSGNPWWCKWPFLLPFSRWTRSPIPALSSSQEAQAAGQTCNCPGRRQPQPWVRPLPRGAVAQLLFVQRCAHRLCLVGCRCQTAAQ